MGIRFFTYNPGIVHYHANFAVFINGQRQEFKGNQYYEETAATVCSVEEVETPTERAHMHDNINNVVHVEDELVTWGNFFQNIGWGLGDDYIKTADNVYTPNKINSLNFMLNGKKVSDITNTIIGDQDKLLISYGSESSGQIDKEYGGIQNNAFKYDNEKDPSMCSGSSSVTIYDRLMHLI